MPRAAGRLSGLSAPVRAGHSRGQELLPVSKPQARAGRWPGVRPTTHLVGWLQELGASPQSGSSLLCKSGR